MNAKQAIQVAKEYLDDVFETESVLEELVFDGTEDIWKITLSFSHQGSMLDLSVLVPGQTVQRDRAYKVVHVDDQSGKAEAVFDRILRPAGY